MPKLRIADEAASGYTKARIGQQREQMVQSNMDIHDPPVVIEQRAPQNALYGTCLARWMVCGSALFQRTETGQWLSNAGGTLLLIAEPAVTASPPPQAIAAGYTTLVFDDEFDTPDTVSPDNKGVHNWYTWNPFSRARELHPDDYKIADGHLTIFTDRSGYGAGLSSANGSNPAISTPQRHAKNQGGGMAFQFGYFEARIRFDPYGHRAGQWPAWWAGSVMGLDPQNKHYDEIDFMEAFPDRRRDPPVAIITTVHEWTRRSHGDASNMQNIDNAPNLSNFDYRVYHVYGCLWTPTSVAWYIDGGLVGEATIGAGTRFRSAAIDQNILILGTGLNWPIEIEYVRVWQ